ncbi:zinc carboxypeptidase [Flavobacteriaceae bacterium MAR_2010_72]|nr:zinc carboxypeptidase [Flavobacteriaceae bacterium MAR_2010_72]TVZ58151.1 zinc carboxypeptidase [Flavobacteriaceae bacterium MAR_2010_105]
MQGLGPKLCCLFSFIAVVNCSAPKSVVFKTPVDTTSKPINYQEKKTYELVDVGVFASNEFHGARLNGFEKINDSTALVLITPENTPINNSPYYAFKSWAKQPKPFYFTFKYPKGFKHRYIPKIEANNNWTVLDSSNIFKNDSIVTIKLLLTNSPQTIAAQEIQSASDVKKWYSTLAIANKDVVTIGSAGKTPLNRDLPVLSIYKGLSKEKDLIVLLTRQHPPEVTGYYAFQSFLETILNGSEVSDQFLAKYHIIAFPIMNPDGVDLGHWRHNSGGVDTNRDWSVYNQPEIQQAVSYIERTLKRNKSKLILGLDFHSTWYDIFYTNEDRANTTMPNFIENWFTALESNIPNYKVNEASANSDKPTSKGWMLNGHNAVGITYEIGDHTPKEDIQIFGKVSAEEMMKIILTK